MLGLYSVGKADSQTYFEDKTCKKIVQDRKWELGKTIQKVNLYINSAGRVAIPCAASLLSLAGTFQGRVFLGNWK